MSSSKELAFLLVFGSLMIAPNAFARVLSYDDALPPVGQRKYVLESNSAGEKMKIVSDKARVTSAYLRDPGLDNLWRPILQRKPFQAPVNEAIHQGFVPVEHSFDAFSVNGRKSEPRMKFVREDLIVDRTDESVDLEPMNSIFEDARAREL